MDLVLEVDEKGTYITICGENNSGKTNTLRAVDLFFNPGKYIANLDAPNHKYYVTRGGTVFPEITIWFLEEKNDEKKLYKIKRIFDKNGLKDSEGEIKFSSSNIKMNNKQIEDFLSKINFFFVESINVSTPELINKIINNVYDLEYANSRFIGLKKSLKESFENYVSGLQEVLNQLARDITPLFSSYKEDWGVKFDVPKDVNKFRDLITDNVHFIIDDKGKNGTATKGSGLQRLAVLLLHFKIIEGIKNGSNILLIDEPDVYLHEGLQKKLYKHLRELCSEAQIFITTHSKNFIDTYTLRNVFLLELNIEERYYQRVGDKANILQTSLVNLEQEEGTKKIKDYLGIEDEDYELLSLFNLLVEGETDKVYIEELSKFFGFNIPNIISAHGADNIEKYLEFYNSYYRNINSSVDKPFLLVLLDNDNKGREVYKKIRRKKYGYLRVKLKFVPNFLGERPDGNNLERISTDHQIEDLLYPRLFTFLVNKLLEKKSLNKISEMAVSERIKQPAHKEKGILYLVENEKNNENPIDGQNINFMTSNHASTGVKEGLAKLLKIQGNKRIVKIIESESEIYPAVKNFLEEVTERKLYID